MTTVTFKWAGGALLVGSLLVAAAHLWFALIRTATSAGSVQSKEKKEQRARQATTAVPLCSREQIQDGEWQKVRLDRPPFAPRVYPPYPCGEVPDAEAYRTGWDTWEWKPWDAIVQRQDEDPKCEFTKWNKELFCELLQNETVVLIGDSLTQEHYLTLSDQLGTAVYPPAPVLHNTSDTNNATQPPKAPLLTPIEPTYEKYACNGTVEIYLRRDDYLNPQKVDWEVNNKLPTIAVLNRGAHHVDDNSTVRLVQAYIESARTWQRKCHEQNRQCTLVWRTSVPGHVNCGQYMGGGAINNLTLMETTLAGSAVARKFHWTDFQRQNQLILRALQESGIDYQILDAYYINMRRPDGHRSSRDCLHSCVGSKIEVYSQILLHFVRMRHQQQQSLDALQQTFQEAATLVAA
jgi:hypothetical protein